MLLTVYPVDGGSPFRFDPVGVERLTLNDPPPTREEAGAWEASVPPPPRESTDVGSGWRDRVLFEWSPPGGIAWCGVRLLVGVDPGRPDPLTPAGAGGPLPGLHGLFLASGAADALAALAGGRKGGEPSGAALSDVGPWMFAGNLPLLNPGNDPGWHWGSGPPPDPRLSAGQLDDIFATAAALRPKGLPGPRHESDPPLIGRSGDGVVWSKPRKAVRWRKLLGRLRGRGEKAMSESWWKKAVRPDGDLHEYVHPDDLARRERQKADGHGGGTNSLTYRVRLDCLRFPWNPESDPAPSA